MERYILCIAFCGLIFETMLSYPLSFFETKVIYQVLWLMIYLYLLFLVFRRKNYSRTKALAFVLAGQCCGILVKVFLDFGQASMMSYLNIRNLSVYLIFSLLWSCLVGFMTLSHNGREEATEVSDEIYNTHYDTTICTNPGPCKRQEKSIRR